MLIQCHTSVSLDPDEPATAIQALVRILRKGAADTEAAQFDVNLVTTSQRGQGVVERFQPQRLRTAASFDDKLSILEELAQLRPFELNSLNPMLTCTGFRWNGAIEGSMARAAVLDGKSFKRKQRFSFVLLLAFEAQSPDDAFIAPMLAEIESLSGIRFSIEASVMHLTASDAGHATADEALATAIVFNEVTERVCQHVRSLQALEKQPHLMTSAQSLDFRFDPERKREPSRVDFTRLLRRWLKSQFPAYAPTPDAGDGYLWREVTPEVLAGFAVDKRTGAYSKAFRVHVGVGLTSKRYAATPERPLCLAADLFRYFGIAPVSPQWTYETAEDLAEAFSGAQRLLQTVLSSLESEAPVLASAYERQLAQCEGPRFLSARDAFAACSSKALDWGADARLLRINNVMLGAPFGPISPLPVSADASGCLTRFGVWLLRFHSRQRQQNLDIYMPCYGPVQQTWFDAPAGRHYPSDVDQMLADSWIDSREAVRIAAAAVEKQAFKGAGNQVRLLILESVADAQQAPVIASPLRDGMFKMRARWRVGFATPESSQRPAVEVHVPAYGDGEVGIVEDLSLR